MPSIRILLLCSMLFCTGCIPTTRVKKSFNLGLKFEPTSDILFLWDNQSEYPLSNKFYKSVEKQFAKRNLSLIEFHSFGFRQELRARKIYIYGSKEIPISDLKEKMGIDYIIKVSISNVKQGNWIGNYDPVAVANFYDSQEISSSKLIIDVLSSEKGKITTRYIGESRNVPLGFSRRDGSEVMFNLGSIQSTFTRSLRRGMQKLLKAHYSDL